MKYHLSYDGNQNNGIIFNDKYTNGSMYIGAEHKPTLSFEYDSMQFSEVFNTGCSVILNGLQRFMEESEQAEVKALAIAWVQPLGQEGNPTLEQAQVSQVSELTQKQSAEVNALLGTMAMGEADSFTKQEVEARAWSNDNTTVTPLVDAILTARASGETKQELVTKIIAKADAYTVAYGAILGKFHKLTKQVDEATTVGEVKLVVW